jgi:hypothetical protein
MSEFSVPPPVEPASAPAPAAPDLQPILDSLAAKVRENPLLWLGGAALVGWALARGQGPAVRIVAEGTAAPPPTPLDDALTHLQQWAGPQLEEYGKRKLGEFLQSAGVPAPSQPPGSIPPSAAL